MDTLIARTYLPQSHLKPSQGVFPYEGTKVGVEKTKIPVLPTVKPHAPTDISFDSIPACDRQTDGRTDIPLIASMHSAQLCYATSHKNTM